jgi:hypothetical protein
MPPSWLNATRCSTPTVYAVRLCLKPRKLNQRRGDLLLTRLLDHLDEPLSGL